MSVEMHMENMKACTSCEQKNEDELLAPGQNITTFYNRTKKVFHRPLS